MPRVNNPTLGELDCDLCSKPASVKQNSKDYFYVGCQDCGVDMRKGAVLQTRVWQKTRWKDDVSPKQPPNLIHDQPEKPADTTTPADEPVDLPPVRTNYSAGGWAMALSVLAVIILPFKGGL